MLTLTGMDIPPETTKLLLDQGNYIEWMLTLDLGPEHPLPL